MKKLCLVLAVCASMLVANISWAVEPADKSESAGPRQSDIAEAAALNWVKDLAHDMQLSADPLARAIAEVALHVLTAAANKDTNASMVTFTEEQKQALYSSKTAMPMRILLLQSACAGFYNQDALCSDPKLAQALIADDGKNAFTVLIAESLRANAALQALTASTTDKGKKSPNPQFRALALQLEKQGNAKMLQALSLSNEYYDYAQAFKAPILIAVKRRPPPPEMLASLPIEISALAAAFAAEEIAAEAFANTLIIWTETNYRHASPCALPETVELKAQCTRIASLILANPKNSAASAGFALRNAEDHAFAKRINLFDGIERQKAVDPSILLTLDWLALRAVLNKAATQGDVSAIPDALAWAELAYAKIPNKSADLIAAETKAHEEQKAMWEAELARNSSTDSAQVAAAAQVVSAAQAAAATTEVDLEFDAMPPPAKASGGCTANAGETVDPTLVEFKD